MAGQWFNSLESDSNSFVPLTVKGELAHYSFSQLGHVESNIPHVAEPVPCVAPLISEKYNPFKLLYAPEKDKRLYQRIDLPKASVLL